MLSRVTLFHLRNDAADMKYLNDIGIMDERSPKGDYVFKQWCVKPGGVLSAPFTGTLVLPDSYLRQLATT